MPRSKVVSPSFIEPMLCLDADELPEGPDWDYQVKLDGYRAQAICDGKVQGCCPATVTTWRSAFRSRLNRVSPEPSSLYLLGTGLLGLAES